MSDNELKSLQVSFGNFSKLHSAYLSNNQISEWPALIVNLSELKALKLVANRLRVLPENIGD
jgi:Leucine-rich repeat (LRR) protein